MSWFVEFFLQKHRVKIFTYNLSFQASFQANTYFSGWLWLRFTEFYLNDWQLINIIFTIQLIKRIILIEEISSLLI